MNANEATPVRAIITWTIKDGQKDAFLAHAKVFAEKTKASEPGCRAVEFYVLPDGRTAIIYEEYANDAAVTAHLKSPVVPEFMPKLMATADGPNVQLFGDTSPANTKAYEGFHATIARRAVGFSR